MAEDSALDPSTDAEIADIAAASGIAIDARQFKVLVEAQAVIARAAADQMAVLKEIMEQTINAEAMAAIRSAQQSQQKLKEAMADQAKLTAEIVAKAQNMSSEELIAIARAAATRHHDNSGEK